MEKKNRGPVWIKNIKPIKRNTKGALGFGIPDHNLKDKDIKANHRYHIACYDLGPEDEINKMQTGGKPDPFMDILEGELDDEIDNF